MPQARVSHLHTFSADGQLYMFACVFSDVTGDTDTSSMLYEWDSSVSMFSGVSVQQLVTRGAKQALTFETDSSLYLIVANSYDSSQQTGDTSSTLYQWSSLNTRLVGYEYQLFPHCSTLYTRIPDYTGGGFEL